MFTVCRAVEYYEISINVMLSIQDRFTVATGEELCSALSYLECWSHKISSLHNDLEKYKVYCEIITNSWMAKPFPLVQIAIWFAWKYFTRYNENLSIQYIHLYVDIL